MDKYSVEAVLKATGADEFTRKFKEAADSVQGIEKQTQGLTLGKLVGAIGITAGLAKGFNLVKDSVGRAFGRIDTMEQFDRVMTTLTGSSEKADQVLGKVNDTVTGTAYGLDVGAKAVQSFVTSNMDVDKATMTFEAWGDAVAFYGDGTNETLGSVTDALAKATAKGKIQMDTMNSLAEAGIPAMQIYADATGKSVEQVADEMSKGKIDAQEFTDIMNDAMMNGTENFESIKGAAKEAGASWTGSFDNMKAAVTRGTIAIIQSIDDMLEKNNLPSMREMVAEFGKKFEEVLKGIAEKIPEIVEKFKSVYNALEPWLPLITAVVAGIASFATTVAIINTVKNVIMSLRVAFALLNATILANPIALVVAALMAAAVLVYVYWEPIKEFFIDLWEAIKESGIAIWEVLKESWSATVEFFVSVWESVKTFFSALWIAIQLIFTTAVTVIHDVVVLIFTTVSDFIMSIFNGVKSFFSAIWSAITSIFTGKLTEILTSVIGKFNEVKSNMQSKMQEAKAQVLSKLIEIVSDFIAKGAEIVSNVINKFNEVKSNIQNKMQEAKNIALQKLVGMVSDFKNKVTEIVSAAKNKFDEVKNAIKDKMTEAVKAVAEKVGEMPGKVTEKAGEMLSAGKDLIGGLIKGIKQMGAKAVEAVTGVVDGVVSKAKSLLKIKSPSRVFMGYGGYISEGLAIGIDNMKRAAVKATESLGLDVQDAFNPQLATDGLDISSRVSDINGQARRTFSNEFNASMSVSKQPIVVNIYDNKEAVRAYVNENNALDAQIRRF